MSRYVHKQIDRQVSIDTESNRQTGRETVRKTGFKSVDGLPMAVAHSTTL